MPGGASTHFIFDEWAVPPVGDNRKDLRVAFFQAVFEESVELSDWRRKMVPARPLSGTTRPPVSNL